MADRPVCRRCGVELTDSTAQGYCLSCLLREGVGSEEQGAGSRGQRSEDGGQNSEVSGQRSAVRSQRTEVKGQKAEDVAAAIANRKSQIANFFGDYELLEKVGQGGMGVVYRARQISLGRIVAVKLLPSEPFRRDDALPRFRTEARAAAGLQHPNIVAIHEVGEQEGQPYFTMDFIEGQTLAEAVRDQPLPAKRAATYLKAIAEAVHYAHEHGILHRDLKPSNVLIDAFDQPQITDFGLAKRLTSDPQLSTLNHQLTLSGQVLGSPNFMSPEQAEGRSQAVGPATDIYSLGALLYHLLTRQPPFQADTLTTLLKQVIEADPVPPRLLNPSIPRDLETVCLKCLEKDPYRRYNTAQTFAEDLGRFLNGQPVVARPVGPAGKAGRWCRRNPRLASAIGVAVVSVLLGFAGILWQWRRAASGELLARQNAYAADMLLAQHALANNNRGLAVSLLDKHRPATSGKVEIRNPKSEVVRRHAPRATDLRGWEWRYLWQLCQGDESFTLHRYPREIQALAVSQDGKVLAVREGSEVALWDVVAKRPLRELPNAATEALAFSPAGRLLAVGSRDAAGHPGIDLWEVSTGRLTKTLRHEADVRSVAFSPDGKSLATFDNRGNIAVVELASGHTLTNFPVRPPRHRPAGVAAFSPEGSRLAVGEDYGGIQILSLGPGTNVQVQTQSREGTTALVFSPGAEVLAAAIGGTIWLCDTRSGQPLAQWTNHTEWVNALAFTPDGGHLVSSSSDGTLRLWSMANRSEVRCLRSSREGLTGLALLPDGTTVVSGGTEGSVCFWDATGSQQVPAHTNLTISFGVESQGDVPRPAFTPGALDPKVVRRTGLTFSADSRSFITTDLDGVLGVWEVQPLRQVEVLSALGSNHWGVALSPDGRWLAVGEATGRVVIWDWPARRAVTHFTVSFEWFCKLRFSHSGSFLLLSTVRNDMTVRTRIWRTGDWEEVRLTGSQLAGLWSVELSPDDRFLATGCADGAVKLWRFPAGQPEATFLNHKGAMTELRFSPEGRVLASVSSDSSIRLWDVAARRELATLRGHLGCIYGATLSPDGRRLATGGGGSKDAVKLWDLETRRELLTLPADGKYFVQLLFSPDGTTLAATTLSGAAHLWRAPSWAEIEAAEKPSVAP